jgi:hypothetical protein
VEIGVEMKVEEKEEEDEEEEEEEEEKKKKKDSPPVAKGGLLTNPAINLKIQNPAKLSTSAVGICNKQKIARGTIYGKFRPICGISVIGAKNNGPIPYPTTIR